MPMRRSAVTLILLAGADHAGSAPPAAESVIVFDETNLPEGVTITKIPLGEARRSDERAGDDIFEQLAGGAGYLAQPATSGTLGIEDYATSLSDGVSDGVDGTGGAVFSLCELGFAGGVAAPGDVLFFRFFTVPDLAAAAVFGVQFASSGNFIYTITIADPSVVNPPVEGVMLIQADFDTFSLGQWFLSDAAASIGAHGQYAEDNLTGPNVFDFGDGRGPVPINHTMRLQAVPAPVVCGGDIDGDNDTDTFDFAELALAFGTEPGDTNWNPAADLVPNGHINTFDFAELAEDFGCDGDPAP